MSERIVKLFWKYIHKAEFDRLSELMSEYARVWLPNTREVFVGKDKYIAFNKRYPGRWLVIVEKIYNCGEIVVSAARVCDAQQTRSFYVTSFFRIENDFIQEITEYWGENGQPPSWRLEEDLSERF